METDTQTSQEVPTYVAGIVIGAILLLVLMELAFRGA